MATKAFSWSEALSFGWNTWKNNIGFFIALALINFVFAIVSDELSNIRGPVGIVFTILFFIPSIIIEIGLIKIALDFVNTGKGDLKDLYLNYRHFFTFLLASLYVGLIIIAGFILLIIPGIIWAIQYQFVTYLIVDKNMGVFESVKISSAITKGIKWDLFVFGAVLLGVNILGALALGIGLLVSIPVSMLAVAHVYRKLIERHEAPQVSEINSSAS